MAADHMSNIITWAADNFWRGCVYPRLAKLSKT